MLPVEARLDVVGLPDELAFELGERLSLRDRHRLDDLGPARHRERLPDRSGGDEIDPVPVGRLEQLRLLVLGSRIQVEARRRDVEVTAVLT